MTCASAITDTTWGMATRIAEQSRSRRTTPCSDFIYRHESPATTLRISDRELYLVRAIRAWAASAFLADQLVFQNTYTAYDNVAYTHGAHNMKFGFEYHHTLFHGLGAPGNIDGTLNYSAGAGCHTANCAVPQLARTCRTSLPEILPMASCW